MKQYFENAKIAKQNHKILFESDYFARVAPVIRN